MIGKGAYGKVYKGDLDHTPVAIKLLHSDASEKKEKFLKEEFFQVVSILIQGFHLLFLPVWVSGWIIEKTSSLSRSIYGEAVELLHMTKYNKGKLWVLQIL